MESIIATLTLATILLIIGLICVVLGVVGLVWKSGHDGRRMEKTRHATIVSENTDSQPPQSPERSLI
jgi:hypothetical protein